jgi:hypothetical protein
MTGAFGCDFGRELVKTKQTDARRFTEEFEYCVRNAVVTA